jgi:hypothetical protein
MPKGQGAMIYTLEVASSAQFPSCPRAKILDILGPPTLIMRPSHKGLETMVNAGFRRSSSSVIYLDWNSTIPMCVPPLIS